MDDQTGGLPKTLTQRNVAGAQAYLRGERRGVLSVLAFAGPAIVASIAYMDPGNFATNIQAGARYGYTLLWVVLVANLIAMLFQALSAKLGIVTGHNLAEMCRLQFPRPVVWAMWVISEGAAMATDLAEFLGGAIGLSLLFHMPLLGGMVVTAIVTYGILLLERRGFRPLELVISALVGVIALAYLIEMFIAPVDWGQAALHTVLPQIADGEALLIAVGIIGATVMPHAVYLHSALTQNRTPEPRRQGAAPADPFLEHRGGDRARRRGTRQSGDGDDGVERLPRRPQRRLRDRDRLSHADAAARRRRRGAVPGVADRLGHLVVGGRHHGRADDHAGLRRLPHPDLAAPRHHHGAGLRRRRHGRQRHAGAGGQPGDPVRSRCRCR